jgi:hypothetical protein
MHMARCTYGFTESVIRRMTRLANEYRATDLAQGFPQFTAPEGLRRPAPPRVVRFAFCKTDDEPVDVVSSRMGKSPRTEGTSNSLGSGSSKL